MTAWDLSALRQLAAMAACCAAMGAQPAPSSDISTLSAASGLPEAEVAALLADCAANQQAQYFCSWRDQLEAERSLDAALAWRAQASPDCGRRLAHEAPRWKQQVQRRCQTAAAREWGGGSLQRTAEGACAAKAFDAAASAVAAGTACRLPAAGR